MSHTIQPKQQPSPLSLDDWRHWDQLTRQVAKMGLAARDVKTPYIPTTEGSGDNGGGREGEHDYD